MNYKNSFVNNIYYHYKYLDNMIGNEMIFGCLVSIDDFKNNIMLKPKILQKNNVKQNLPFITNISSEIKNNYKFTIEMIYLSFCILSGNFYYIMIYNLTNLIYYYIICMMCYGINDFNTFQALNLTIFKMIITPWVLFDYLTVKKYYMIQYPNMESSKYIIPNFAPKNIFKNGYQNKLSNYNLDIVYLKGSYYDMGKTLGTIYRKEINQYMKLLDRIIPPTSINPLWKNCGYKARTILKVIKEHSWKYISTECREEIMGIVEGAKVDLNDYILLSLFPSIFKAHCTILTDENVFLRTLDIDLYYNNYAIIIYHPCKGNIYGTFTLPGMSWCVTGFSKNLVIGEVFNDYCKISTNRNGCPFYYNFKDILMKCNDISDTIKLVDSMIWHDSIDIAIRSMKTNQVLMIEKEEIVQNHIIIIPLIITLHLFKVYFQK